jgi:CRISPR-associated endoribonuclease Cas6
MDDVLHNPLALFSFETFRFHLRIRSLTVLPPYKGAVFRGALDNAFRRLVCPLPRNDCTRCEIKARCLYIALFQPKPPADFPDAGKFDNAPAPYVLRPPPDNRKVYHPQDTLTFELTLIGRALDALPYFVFAIDQIGRRGLGTERGRYELRQVELHRNGQSRVIYDGNNQVLHALPPPEPDHRPPAAKTSSLTLDLKTPLRIKQNGKLVTRLDFTTFFDALARRLALLGSFYGQNGPPDFSGLLEQAKEIKTVEDRTFWYDWPRYSTRQRELMKLGGLRGEISFAGDLTQFIPWLHLGEKLHFGQGTTFGLGFYFLHFSQDLQSCQQPLLNHF